MHIRKFQIIYIFCISFLISPDIFSIEYYQAAPFLKKTEPKEIIPSKSLYQEYINKGNEYLQENRIDEASDIFWKAAELFPQIPDAYINLAIIQIRRRNLEGAIRLLNTAQSLAPKGYSKKDILIYNLGLCFQLKGDYSKAEEYYQKVLNINPYLGETFFNLGLVYIQLGQKEEAFIKIYKARCIFEESNKIEYVKIADRWLADLKKDYRINYSSLAKKLLEEGSKYYSENKDIDKAISLIKESTLLDTNYAEAYYRLGVIYAYKGKFVEAIEYFNKAIELKPDFTKAYINLGSAYGKLKKYKKALEFFCKALELDKENPKIYYNIGMVYWATGKKSKAKDYFRKAKNLSLKKKDYLLLEKIEKFL